MRERLSTNQKILFWSNWKGKAEFGYSKLPPANKDNEEPLKKEFLDFFAMEDVDRKTHLVSLQLETSNLRQGDTENTAEFVTRADVLSQELPRS